MNHEMKSQFLGIPSWIVALILAFISFIILFILAYPLGETIGYLSYTLIIVIGSYMICKVNPKSKWYVPILANVFGIVAALGEEEFYWMSKLMVIVCTGFILSVVASVLGAEKGLKDKQ